MNRRDVIKRGGQLLSLSMTGVSAACLDGGSRANESKADSTVTPVYTYDGQTATPTPAGVITKTLDFTTPDPETIKVTVTLVNRSSKQQTVKVEITVKFDNTTKQQSKQVTIAGDATKDITYSFTKPAKATLKLIDSNVTKVAG